MGNLAARCFADDKDLPNDRTNQKPNQDIAPNGDITLPQINKEEIVQQDDMQKQSAGKCQLTQNHFQVIHSSEIHQRQQPQQSRKSNSMPSPFVKLTEPLAILHNDPISNYTSSWFQLTLALPKYQKRRDHYEEQQEQLYFDQSKIPLGDNDLYALFCLKWCVVDYFSGEEILRPQHQLLLSCCDIFDRIVQTCKQYQQLFLSCKSDNQYLSNIKRYVQYYSEYQKEMNFYQTQYDVLGDLIQNLYAEYFDFKNEQEIPHFKIVGYMMRMWCQVMLTEDIQEILLDSYRNCDWRNDFSLAYSYINAALDTNLNECNIHWIGYCQYCKIEKRLIDINFNLIDQYSQKAVYKDNEEFYALIDKKLEELRFSCPTWFFEIEFLKLAIQHKIIRLVKEVSKQNEQEVSKIRKNAVLDCTDSADHNSFSLILNTTDTLSKESQEQGQQLMALYLQEFTGSELIPRSKLRLSSTTPSTNDSLESKIRISNSLTSTLKASEEALLVSKEISVEYKQKLQKFNDELKDVEIKIAKREFILSQRAERLKINPLRNFEWLNFFHKTDFVKIPDCQKKPKQYIIRLLKYLSDNDPRYNYQLEKFI